jgi:hypothetical protein
MINKSIKQKKYDSKRVDEHADNINKLIIVGILVLLAISIIINSVYLVHRNNNSKASTPQSNSGQVLTSLQTGFNGATQVRVSDVTENNSFDPAFTLDPTETMLIMSITITNLSAETQQLIPDTQLFVRTDQGNYSTIHASMFVTNPLSSVDLRPGQSASGQVSFNVPKVAEKPYLYIDTEWDNYTPLVFNVLH